MPRLTCHFAIFIALQTQLFAAQGTTSDKQSSTDLSIGNAVVRNVEHGRYVQYVPKSVNKTSTLLVVCHGMFGSGDAEDAAKGAIDDWLAFGEKHKLIVVAPIFDNENYACSKPGAFGGYRTLTGRIVGADVFLHEIVERYEKMNPEYDGRFFIFGHSAGAQFANRYVVRHPKRVLGALISSPAWFSFPDENQRWAEGMGARKGKFKWGDTDERINVDVAPDPQTWLDASKIPITVIVGELDTDELKDTGKTHVSQAKDWVQQMNSFAASRNVTSQIKLKVVDGVGHNYGKLTRAGMKDLGKVVLAYKRTQRQNVSQLSPTETAIRNVSLSGIPDLTQTLKGAGFAGGGSQFCAPVSVSNSLAWLEARGEDQAYQVQLVKKLASPNYMHTKLTNGTGTVELMRGVNSHAIETWGKFNRLEYAGWRSCPSGTKVAAKPTIKWMVDALHYRAAVWINVGWYVKRVGGGQVVYERTGGHWVTLVGHSNGQLILHDPAPRSGKRPRKEMASYAVIPNGVQTGNKRGLPVNAFGSIELIKGLAISSKANTAIIDGAVVFELKAPDPFRTWTSANGNFSMRARFTTLRQNSVCLEKEDGSLMWIEVSKLDTLDQDYIKQKSKEAQ